MATPPIICETIDFQGIIFQRCNLQSVKGSTVISEMSLCDTDIVINNYSAFSGCIYGNSSLLLSPDGLGDIEFIMIKVTYPSTLPIASRFINIYYNGAHIPMSGLTILTGNSAGTITNLPKSWDLNPDQSDVESPFFIDGGMLLQNPHSVRVNVEVILADGIRYGH
jgi:hypothetical protein